MQWKLENERVFAHLARHSGCVGRRRKNLHSRLGTSPPGSDSKTTEGNFPPDLVRCSVEKRVNGGADLLPFVGIKRWSSLHRGYGVAFESQSQSAGFTSKRKIDPIVPG